MIKCPGCGNTLPDSFVRCQFCGADTTSVPRPAPVQKSRAKQAEGAPAWVTPAYYAVCGYYILSGLVSVITGLKSPGVMILGGINICFGIGLAAKIDFIRGIANIICWIQIVLGALGIMGALALSALIGPLAFVLVGLDVIQIGAAGFMIYLIGETDEFINI